MKKLIIIYTAITCLCMLFISPIKANSTQHILVSIKEADSMYLIALSNNTMKVKSISSQLYTNVSCLDNERTTLNSVDFNNAATCLNNTIENTFDIEIDNYIVLDMKKLIKDVGLKKSAYDYKTLHSLTDVSKQILDHIKPSMFVHYQDYIETDLSLLNIYDLYKFFKKDDFKTKYYHLQYFTHKDQYILFDTTFHLQKRLKK